VVLPAQGGSASGGKAHNKMYYVYIIQSEKTGKLYKGSSDDLKDRIPAHNAGKVFATKNGRPWKLIYYGAFVSKTDARREELFLKTGKGRERVKYLLKDTLAKDIRLQGRDG
jgi:putative endonuclease